ncbi:MAG TPA: sigma-E factor negative regulatory protein [Nevskiaceae bacterium]|nr:sigma-E factor negative regulatory protein [Nevskiaceae bacterium]
MTSLEESLSALTDGECTASELDALLDACDGRPELLQRFGRHCAVREVHTGRVVYGGGESLCASIMSKLDQPPAHVAHVSSVGHRIRRRRGRWQSIGGLAMAASLGAVVAVSGYRFAFSPGPAALGGAGTTVAQASPVPGAASANGSAHVNEVRWSQLDPRTTQRLDGYLIEHVGYGAESMMSGTLNYARLATQPVSYSPVRGAH